MKREEDPVRRTALVAALCFAFAAAPALAGLVGEFESKPPTGTATAGKMLVEPDRLRIESAEGTVIFRGDKQVLWMVSEKDKSYRELTKADVQKMADQMSTVMPQIEEQLKNMSPEERAMVEGMMKGKMGGAMAGAAAKKMFVKTGATETVNGFPCSIYDTMRGEDKIGRVWVTDYKSLGVTRDDMKAFDSMIAFIEPMMGPLKDMFSGLIQKSGAPDDKTAIPGFPIRTVTTGKKGDRVEEVKSLKHETIPASVFDLPAGLKKESMEMGG